MGGSHAFTTSTFLRNVNGSLPAEKGGRAAGRSCVPTTVGPPVLRLHQNPVLYLYVSVSHFFVPFLRPPAQSPPQHEDLAGGVAGLDLGGGRFDASDDERDEHFEATPADGGRGSRESGGGGHGDGDRGYGAGGTGGDYSDRGYGGYGDDDDEVRAEKGSGARRTADSDGNRTEA